MLHNTRQQYENQDFSAHCYRFPVVWIASKIKWFITSFTSIVKV
jgi:hypothetical protein